MHQYKFHLQVILLSSPRCRIDEDFFSFRARKWICSSFDVGLADGHCGVIGRVIAFVVDGQVFRLLFARVSEDSVEISVEHAFRLSIAFSRDHFSGGHCTLSSLFDPADFVVLAAANIGFAKVSSPNSVVDFDPATWAGEKLGIWLRTEPFGFAESFCCCFW